MAASLTLAMFFGLTLFACTTKQDFTLMGGLIFVIAIVLMMMSIFAFFTDNGILRIIICGVGVILFSLYILYDTQ